jgi:hypothetical protein
MHVAAAPQVAELVGQKQSKVVLEDLLWQKLSNVVLGGLCTSMALHRIACMQMLSCSTTSGSLP